MLFKHFIKASERKLTLYDKRGEKLMFPTERRRWDFVLRILSSEPRKIFALYLMGHRKCAYISKIFGFSRAYT